MTKISRFPRIIMCLVTAAAAFLLFGCADKAVQIEERIGAADWAQAESLEDLEAIEADYQALDDEEKTRVGNHVELERKLNSARFLAALEQSVTTRMENSDTDNYTSLVNNELALLEEFRGLEFFGDEVASAAEDYLSGLDCQKEALGKIEQYCDYQVLWSEGACLRSGALKSLNKSLGFMDGNAEFKADYVMAYDRNKAYYEAIVAIEDDIEAQSEAEQLGIDGSLENCDLNVTLMNNTDYSFESVWEIDFISEDGTVLYSTQTEVSVNPKAKYVVTVYAPSEVLQSFETFNWVNWYSNIYV